MKAKLRKVQVVLISVMAVLLVLAIALSVAANIPSVQSIAFTYLDWTLSLKWYILDAVLLLAFLMAMPDGEISRRFWKSFWSIPGALLKSVFSGGKKEKQ